jgi:hypothetical protein
MTAEKLAAMLTSFKPAAEVLIFYDGKWRDVVDVDYTGMHRNAVTFRLSQVEPELPGVIVVAPDIEPKETT